VRHRDSPYLLFDVCPDEHSEYVDIVAMPSIDALVRMNWAFFMTTLRRSSGWQLGGLRVLRGVIHGFSEEARTRGFPSPPFWQVWLLIYFEDSIIRITTYEHYGNYVALRTDEKVLIFIHYWDFSSDRACPL